MKKIIWQIAKLFFLLFAISIITFLLMKLTPINPVSSYLGADSNVTQEQYDYLVKVWGLNQPSIVQYFNWIKEALTGNMGDSFIYNKPVSELISKAASNTFMLMLTSWLLSGIIGFILGIVAAAYHGRVIDQIIQKISYLFASMPTFWFAILMLMFFAVKLGWFPVGMSAPIGVIDKDISLWDRIHHMILPAMTLSILGISKIALHTREKLIDVLNSEYFLYSKVNGEKLWEFIRKHGIRNILLPAVTIQFASISELFGGSVLVENVFSYAGLGNITKIAGVKGDMPLLLAITLVSAIFVFVGNLCANILYPIIDPRIREGMYNDR